MSITLGQSYQQPSGTSSSVIVPSQTAPTKQLLTDIKQQIPVGSEGAYVDTYKLLASSSDGTPGYLSSKITSGEFSIVSNKLKLAGFGSLTTTNLAEGTNLYFTEARFESLFSAKTSDDITEGTTNYFFTNTRFDTRFDTDFAAKDTDDLTEGSTNLYLTTAISDAVTLNTSARHSHANKTILDSITASNLVTSATTPIVLSSGILSHSTADGYKHVPANSTTHSNYILKSGATAGTYTWETFDSVAALSNIFETTPTTSTVRTVTSNYIKTHVENSTTDINHLTDDLLAYIDTGGDVPVHLADTLIHLPAINPTTDQGKFLFVNTSYEPEWTNSAVSLIKAGTGTYVNVSGSTVTVDKIDISDTNIIAGSNITISTNTISATQRTIVQTPGSGETTYCISSDWANTHTSATGAGYHIPTGGTSTQYIAGDGTIKDFSAASGGIFKITMGAGATGSVAERLADGDTEFPSGWSGAVGGVTTDLVITHTAAKNPVNVKIYTDDGTDITMLMGSAPYSTIIGNQASTEIKIVSLTTITEKIYIYIQFE